MDGNPRELLQPLEAAKLTDEFISRHDTTFVDPTLRLQGEWVIERGYYCQEVEDQLLASLDWVALLRDATLHQFHGGIATGATKQSPVLPQFHAEYPRVMTSFMDSHPTRDRRAQSQPPSACSATWRRCARG